jgi:zinc transporter ZupT
MVLTWILEFALLGSVGAISAAASFMLFPKRVREQLVPFLVSYATGTLLGAARLGLLPEAIEQGELTLSLGTVLARELLDPEESRATLMPHLAGEHQSHWVILEKYP